MGNVDDPPPPKLYWGRISGTRGRREESQLAVTLFDCYCILLANSVHGFPFMSV